MRYYNYHLHSILKNICCCLKKKKKNRWLYYALLFIHDKYAVWILHGQSRHFFILFL